MGPHISEALLTVEHRPARVFVGGDGVALLLVHGGWGGASPCWRFAWDALVKTFRVVAPDLPGIGDTASAGLHSLADYARWLAALVDAAGLEDVWCVGNSFGASVVHRFALDFPDKCRGLVFVNGFPLPHTPGILSKLGDTTWGRHLVEKVEMRVAYTESALRAGFVDVGKVPEEIRALVRSHDRPTVATMAEVIVHGGGKEASSRVAPLLLWGEGDRLPGTSSQDARKLHASIAGSTLAFVPHAGHMPQIENPSAFVETLTAFVLQKEGVQRVTVH